MAFVTDTAELKPGLVIFRRGDVEHRMWYCRMKIPKADRYKTVSFKNNGYGSGEGTRLQPGRRYPVPPQA